MPPIKIYKQDYIATPAGRVWKAFSKNPFALIGLWGVCFLLLLTILAPFIAPYSVNEQNQQILLLPPSWDPLGHVEYFLGTDDLGRDIFSRILHGVQLTFGMSLIIVSCALFFGFLIGSISGMMRGLKSSILGHLLDALLSIPSLLMAILVVAVIGPGLYNVFWAVGIAMVPQFIRTIHQAVHEELQKEYVTAAKLDGANNLQIFWYVIMPNVWEVLIIQITMAISAAILDIAALGFLNLGAQAPSPEWGAMIAQGLDNLLLAPWTVTIPGVAILFSVLAVNLVGDGLRSAIAPIRN
ncbi:ABC transporter permease subunit [Shewanella glacialimarina]|jgi:cationic peptide transport system permease protein|uniref:ABC transporter permease subunit n=1 Tax=Shewanella glacialimarina TaxID=2590884 RepID=UPI001CF83188|nr:ABC transporter permease subunit [Shewanella glacialimarina]UCX04166.1 ABC transporter permease subunit [Shewanella glacialimarina]